MPKVSRKENSGSQSGKRQPLSLSQLQTIPNLIVSTATSQSKNTSGICTHKHAPTQCGYQLSDNPKSTTSSTLIFKLKTTSSKKCSNYKLLNFWLIKSPLRTRASSSSNVSIVMCGTVCSFMMKSKSSAKSNFIIRLFKNKPKGKCPHQFIKSTCPIY